MEAIAVKMINRKAADKKMSSNTPVVPGVVGTVTSPTTTEGNSQKAWWGLYFIKKNLSISCKMYSCVFVKNRFVYIYFFAAVN